MGDTLKNGRVTKYSPTIHQRIVGALAGGGTMADAARAAGVSRKTLYQWRDKHPELASEMDDARDEIDDIVEQRLFDLTAKDTTACIYWLKNRRPQSWRDRHEPTVTEVRPIQIIYGPPIDGGQS